MKVFKLRNVSLVDFISAAEDRSIPKVQRVASAGKNRPSKTTRQTRTKTRNRSLCPQTGKRRYRDDQAAKMALRRSQSAGEIERDMYGSTSRREARYYSCPYCNSMHLTALSAQAYAASFQGVAA